MKAFLVLILISSTALAHDTSGLISRRSCPEAVVPDPAPTLESLQPKFAPNNIEVMRGSTVTGANVSRFLTEYEKFPQYLRTEMVGRGAKIRLMEETGVGRDPSMTATRTTEGTRDWVDVPGSGGEAIRGSNVPTRIAVNHLYENHGASNLVLHEHAHTLDSIYERQGVSKSKVWMNLMNSSTATREFTLEICGQYCMDREEERFAELFAYYFACEASRKHLEEEVPAVAEFFSKLTNVKSVMDGIDPRTNSVVTTVAPVPTPAPTPVVPQEECLSTDIKNSAPIQPLKALVPYVQSIVDKTAPGSFSNSTYTGGSTSAAGMK
jgi:hypothetical protein